MIDNSKEIVKIVYANKGIALKLTRCPEQANDLLQDYMIAYKTRTYVFR